MADPLTTAQIERFARDGYLILRGMAAPSRCAALRAVAAEQLQAAEQPLEYEAELGYAQGC